MRRAAFRFGPRVKITRIIKNNTGNDRVAVRRDSREGRRMLIERKVQAGDEGLSGLPSKDFIVKKRRCHG